MRVARALIVAAIGILLTSFPAMASSPHSSSPLNLNLAGVIVDAGHQHYDVSGGQLVTGSVNGHDVSGAPIEFNLDAVVNGLHTSGEGGIQIASSADSHDSHDSVQIDIAISGQTPAAVFPLTSSLANCDPSVSHCTSEIPLMFTGVATINAHGSDSQGNSDNQGESDNGGGSVNVPIAVESPYWNPFGHPIVIASLDSPTSPLIFLVVTYDHATIDWKGVVLQGVAAGTLGSDHTVVSGLYTTVSSNHEDLVAGSEQDHGRITFSQMTPSSLNTAGEFDGTTQIPSSPSYDCTSPYAVALGFLWPFGPGTCTLTGANSQGSFQMHGGSIDGSYDTIWSVPSLTTTTTVTATVGK